MQSSSMIKKKKKKARQISIDRLKYEIRNRKKGSEIEK
jgi:hypothetical protein